jgi:hypothetical protein
LLAATNAASHHSRVRTLHEDAARSLGYTPSPVPSDRFNLDAHLVLIEAIFPHADRRTRDDAFVFPSVEPVLRYSASGPIDAIQERQAEGSHRHPLLKLMGERIPTMIQREGNFRDPKTSGCFVAW